MKKYFSMLIFFIGCFFMLFSTGSKLVSAEVIATTESDSYDSRIVKISLSGLSPRTDKIVVSELVSCEISEDGCSSYTIGNEDKSLKAIESIEYTSVGDITQDVTYTITSTGDGIKYLLVKTFQEGRELTQFSCIVEYNLSTLIQRVVINPNGNLESTNVYNNIQYSAVRTLSININLYEDELETYSGIVYVCEVEDEVDNNCGGYQVSEGTFEYGIQSYGDGEKTLHLYLVKSSMTINDLSELKNKSLLISKNIYLDTIGPEITIEGGNWVFVESGKKYTEQKATCQDAIFTTDTCTVTNDLNVVRIDYTSDKYQIITYQASDRLGNVSSATVKVKVEQTTTDNSKVIYFSIAGCVVVITGLILGYVLIKNREKKKKMSYI